MKHRNPCGVAGAPDLFDAWIKAWQVIRFQRLVALLC
ncbi:MAG: hypothetical protein IPO83_09980 [Chitinophagaceae bacterium]|nr:hypothetical protein [Chitinophagaceae bacterium]